MPIMESLNIILYDFVHNFVKKFLNIIQTILLIYNNLYIILY